MTNDQDKKEAEKPKPKDISKISTDNLVNEFVEMDAKLETALQKEVITRLKLKPVAEEKIKAGEKTRMEETKEVQEALQKKLEKTPAEYRKRLEADYRRIEEIRDNPESFKTEVGKRRTALLKDLTKDVATSVAELDTKIEKQAREELKFPIDEADLKTKEKAAIDGFIELMDKTNKAMEKDLGSQEEADMQTSLYLQGAFKKIKEIKNNPDAFKAKVEERKADLQKQGKIYGEEESPSTVMGDMIRDMDILLAQSQAGMLPKSDILWKEPVSDTLSLASLPRSTVRGAA